jgi:hypothetical protein
MRHHLQGLLIALAIGAGTVAGYAADHPVQRSNSTMHTDSPVPNAASFTSAPLRNRTRVELKAPVPNVWALIGDLTRYPEYSSGLERVEVKEDSSGMLTEYVCRFKPQEEGGESIAHRELIRWYEPNRGYASISEEPNAFGLTNSLTLVTLDPSKEGTIMTWDEYFDAQDLDTNRALYDQALADIAERLIARFGGRIIERYVEGPR